LFEQVEGFSDSYRNELGGGDGCIDE